jgi:hypothetical protein
MCASNAPYSDGTARKQSTPCVSIASSAASADSSAGSTSVPPLSRLNRMPAIELSNAIDDSSRNRGDCSPP